MSFYGTQQDIALKIGCSKQHVGNMLNSGKIPQKFLKKVRSHGKDLTRIHTDFVEHYLETRERKQAGKRNPAESSDLQTRKLKAEISKLEEQTEHWRLKIQDLQGKYMLKTDFERALAERAAIFKQDLETLATSKVRDIVRMAEGKPETVPEVIKYIKMQHNIILKRYAD